MTPRVKSGNAFRPNLECLRVHSRVQRSHQSVLPGRRSNVSTLYFTPAGTTNVTWESTKPVLREMFLLYLLQVGRILPLRSTDGTRSCKRLEPLRDRVLVSGMRPRAHAHDLILPPYFDDGQTVSNHCTTNSPGRTKRPGEKVVITYQSLQRDKVVCEPVIGRRFDPLPTRDLARVPVYFRGPGKVQPEEVVYNPSFPS